MKTYFEYKEKTIDEKVYIIEEDGYIKEIGFGKFPYGDILLKKTELVENLISQISEYFSGRRFSFDIRYKIGKKTDFEQKVICELKKIPYGKTVSYRDIAVNIKSPSSYRAVANAVSKNPLLLLIPCHRVILSSGKTGGYRGGENIKKQLLDLENKYKKTV